MLDIRKILSHFSPLSRPYSGRMFLTHFTIKPNQSYGFTYK